MKRVISTIAVGAAQTLGKGGTMVREGMAIPHCPAPLGTVALVETKHSDNASGQLPPGLAALMAMARAQRGMATGDVDPVPLMRMIVAQSGCFQVVDCGEGFDALQRERALAAGQQTTGEAPAPTLTPADYLLTATIVYQDEDAGSSGGALRGLRGGYGGAAGIRSKKLETQTMLTLTSVKTGVQQAVATGEARKRDIRVIAGGLVGLGIGAIGGNDSTDIGKLTAASLIDAFAKLAPQFQSLTPVATVAPSPAPAPAAPAPSRP
ncbi:CsgG/HfaB family protein [Sphingomonas oryzagri]